MGRWDFKNIGASAKPENKKMVEKIFEYIGFAPEPEYAGDGEERSFADPDVYCCMYSANEKASGKIKNFIKNEYCIDMDLLYLLNALFPKTNIYVYSAEGNNTSDVWENHETIYDTSNMTCYDSDSYTAYGGPGPSGHRSSKHRFALKAPEKELVSALIEQSITDGNTELTGLLTELSEKLRDGLIVYEDDSTDQRKINERYDVKDDVTGDEDPEVEYFEYLLKKMPLKNFVELYKVKPIEMTEEDREEFIERLKRDPDIFNEEDYNIILGDLIDRAEYSDHNPFDIDYNEFAECLEDNEYEFRLDEEAYQNVREKVKKLDIASAEDFQYICYDVYNEEDDEEEENDDYSDDEEDRDEE